MDHQRKFGVALSGGGYRAAAFHLGTLRKLADLSLLDKIDVISSISGGSITAAAYCLNKQDYIGFEQKMITSFSTKSAIGLVLRSWEFIRTLLFALAFIGISVYISFTPSAPFAVVPIIVLVVLLVAFQFRLFPVARVIERAYDQHLFHGATLPDLCERPKLAIGSTNLQTSRPFTFSRERIEDSSYKYGTPSVTFLDKGFPVARAVTASSCVPFAFSPVSIAKEFFTDQRQYELVRPELVDGGVFDNQGLHKLTEIKSEYNCDIVLVSDAGNRLPFEENYNNTFTLLLRTVNVFMQRIKNFQSVRNVYDNKEGRQIAYLSLPWTLDKCVHGFISNLKSGNISQELITMHRLKPEWVANPDVHTKELNAALSVICNYDAVFKKNLGPTRLAAIWNIGTNLTTIKKNLIMDMIIHAANLTEIQLRLYCPSLFITNE